MDLRQKKQDLSWFFDFLTHQFYVLPYPELMSRSFELAARMGVVAAGEEPEWDYREFLARMGVPELAERGPSVLRAEMAEIQRQLREFVDNTLSRLEVAQDTFYEHQNRAVPAAGASLRKPQEILEIANVDFLVRLKATVNADTLMFADHGDDSLPPFFSTWAYEDFEQATIRVRSITSRNTSGLIFHFLQALDGTAVGEISKCRACGRWFVRTSKRARYYCSHGCASKDGHQRKRPMMSEEERQRERDRAHENYKRRVRSDPEHPRAKVERRPRKKKGAD